MPPSLPLSCYLTILLSCYLLFSACTVVAQRPGNNQSENNETNATSTSAPSASPTPSPQAWTVGRMFSISTKQPMRQVLLREKDYTEGLGTAQRYVEAIEASVIRKIRRHNGILSGMDDVIKTTMRTTDEVNPCGLDNLKFYNAVGFHLELRRLPLPDLSCLSEYIGPVTNLTAKQVFDSLHRRGEAVYRNRFRIADVIVGNWTNSTDFPYEFEYQTDTTSCHVNFAGGIRVYGKWYMINFITNFLGAVNVAGNQRKVLSEYHHVLPNNTLGNALHMTMGLRPPDGDASPHKLQPNTTTLLLSTGGNSQPSHFGRILLDNIPALVDATETLDLSIQQANDALSKSSIAILVLPLVLNLIPSMIFMPVSSSWTILMYIIITDIVTVVPLCIKGIELVVIGHHQAYSVSGRITSPSNGSLGASAGAHIWAARCYARKNLVDVGITFICLAIGTLLIGIGLECISRDYLLRAIDRMNVRVGWDNQQFETFDDHANINFSSDSMAMSFSPRNSANDSALTELQDSDTRRPGSRKRKFENVSFPEFEFDDD